MLVTSRSGVGSRLRALGPLGAMLLAGCGGDNTGYLVLGDEPSNVLKVDVDVGASLILDPGKGIGVAVTTPRAGSWRIDATCDSLASGYSCGWDLVASIDSSSDLSVDDESALEAPDRVLRVDRGAVRLLMLSGYGDDPVPKLGGDAGLGGDASGAAEGGIATDAGAPADGGTAAEAGPVTDAGSLLGDLDTVLLSAPEGKPLRLDLVLDGIHGAYASDTVFWVESGSKRQGAPSNPIVFDPIEP